MTECARRAIRRLPVLASLLFLVAVAANALPSGTAALRPLVKPGEKASSFTLKTLDGKSMTFRPGDGKAALLVFWSAFCPLCRELTPSVSGIARRHAPRVRVIGVNLDGHRFRNAVTAFVKENEVAFPILLDDIRDDLFVASDPYGVEKTPTAVLVDGSGVVRAAFAAESMRGFLGSFDRFLSDLEKGHAVKK